MAKKKGPSKLLHRILIFFEWATGVLVALAVAFGMIDGRLSIKWIPMGTTMFFGWVIVVTTLIGMSLAISEAFK